MLGKSLYNFAGFRSVAMLIGAAALLASAGSSAPATAQSGDGFAAYLESLWPKAQARGVSRGTFDSVMRELTYNPRVIALDRDNLSGGSTADAPIPPFAPYKAKHVDTQRITRGRATYAKLRPLLLRIEQDTGVPESVMVAIYGHETNYGAVTGDFDLPRSLATLAFEGRRRSLFEPELLATLEMVERGVPRSNLVGSWAGAFGYPQFLPSVYLRMARDGDGDGKARIWSSEADALASIAAYLSNAGWRKGQPWGFAVTVPSGLNRQAILPRTHPTRCPRVFARHSQWRSLAEWQAMGVTRSNGAPMNGAVQATLIEPDGQGKTAYLLTSNYRAILDYNCSNFYALSVGLLADEVAR